MSLKQYLSDEQFVRSMGAESPEKVAVGVGGIVTEVAAWIAAIIWGWGDLLVTEVALQAVGDLTGSITAYFTQAWPEKSGR